MAESTKNGPTKGTDEAKVDETKVDEAKVEDEKVETKTETFYNANDGLFGRNGGPYLDEVEAVHHERQQAIREGKEPDYDNPRGYPGIVLRTGKQQVENYNSTLIAGDDRRSYDAKAALTAPTYTTAEVSVAGDEGETPVNDDKPADNGFSFEDLDKLGV